MPPYTLFIGCNIPARVPAYQAAARSVLTHLGVPLLDLESFGCCGYPVRNAQQEAWLLAAAANLALAETERVDLLVLCKCCFGSFKAAQYVLDQQPELHQRINQHLRPQGLSYQGRVTVKHLLTVLHQDIGVETIAARLKRPLKDVKVATHYGCHALRPSRITGFADPVAPTIFEELVQSTGAQTTAWSERLECCGAPLLGTHDALAQALKQRKIDSARSSGADLLCTACPWCQIQFEEMPPAFQGDHIRSPDRHLPGILYPQLLGHALGLPDDALMISPEILTHTLKPLDQEHRS